ncbi:DUF6705 family protein [Bacteroides sp. AN502(2024)]|uniref:DUF6705 family protein n=1 Tax=Bacteroides sp. AN502(2024) TaxID=3160599 RepID=UPI0035146859
MKTSLFILLFSFLFSFCAIAQKTVYQKAAYDLTPFTGTWVAMKDSMKYEITFKKGILKNYLDFEDTNYESEIVFATLVRWYKNGTLIREVKSNTPESILKGFIGDTDPLCLGSVLYIDKERKCYGDGTFTIDRVVDPKVAKWAHSYSSVLGGKSAFPARLDFIKVK